MASPTVLTRGLTFVYNVLRIPIFDNKVGSCTVNRLAELALRLSTPTTQAGSAVQATADQHRIDVCTSGHNPLYRECDEDGKRPMDFHETLEPHSPGAHLAEIMHDQTRLQAIALTPKAKTELLHFAVGSRLMDRVESDFDRLEATLQGEAAALSLQMAALPPSASNRVRSALQVERWRKTDKLTALKVCWNVMSEDDVIGPAREFQNMVFDRLARADLIPRPSKNGTSAADIETILTNFSKAQEALSWGTNHISSLAASSEHSTETPEQQRVRLNDKLNVARKELLICREDWTGRQAQAGVRDEAARAKISGLEYPPTEVVDQFALVERTDAIDTLIATEKIYRDLKRRMRRKGYKIERVLDDDSEFSFDIDEEQVGSPLEDHPDRPDRSQHRKRWQQSLEACLPLPGPDQQVSPPASLPGSRLSWPTINSGVTTKQEQLKLIKRSQMWMRLQKESAVAGLKGRERSTFPPRKKRFMRRRLNNFLAARPIHFRMTNNEPRHRKSRPRGGTDSSRLSSHGEFEFWDREEDPPAQSQAGGSTADAGPFEKSDGSRKRDDAANRRDHDSENSSKRQTTPSQSRKRGAEDKDLASPSKRVQI